MNFIALAEIIAGMKDWLLSKWIAVAVVGPGMILIATSIAQPAGTGEIRGYVADSVGAKIRDASVFVHKKSAQEQAVKLVTHTDIHGEFVLHLPQGGYDVLVTSVGFKSEAETIAVFSGKTKNAKWKLRALSCEFPGMNCDSVQ